MILWFQSILEYVTIKKFLINFERFARSLNNYRSKSLEGTHGNRIS